MSLCILIFVKLSLCRYRVSLTHGKNCKHLWRSDVISLNMVMTSPQSISLVNICLLLWDSVTTVNHQHSWILCSSFLKWQLHVARGLIVCVPVDTERVVENIGGSGKTSECVLDFCLEDLKHAKKVTHMA